MIRLDKDTYARLEFQFDWPSEMAVHKERYLAPKVNMWRDFFPPGLKEELMGKKPGERVFFEYQPGQIFEPYSNNKVLTLKKNQFQKTMVNNKVIFPRFGRFYPQGLLKNVIGIYPQNIIPFRVISLNHDTFIADLNHPLARFPIKVQVKILEAVAKTCETGGQCKVWHEEVGDKGPGMQARWQGQPTSFFENQTFCRDNEEEDRLFHLEPRLVGHVDSQASAFIQEIYQENLEPGMRVLDLMSSVQSHMPLDLDIQVTGLGLNQEEMDNNPRLDDHQIQDLNIYPSLPYPDNEFDLVACSLSIEYLVNPFQVMNEVYRVLRPGGLCLISFSNRWFPPKVTYLWTELTEFERIGLIIEYFAETGGFTDLTTYSVRNWFRPETDRRANEIPTSDPVYVLRGKKL